MGARDNKKTHVTLFTEKIEGSDRVGVASRASADYVIGEVRYTKGGTNWFSGNNIRRGYRVTVDIRERGAGFEVVTLGDNIGKTDFLQETHAFSDKTLQSLALKPEVLQRAQDLKASVLALYEQRKRMKAEQEARRSRVETHRADEAVLQG